MRLHGEPGQVARFGVVGLIATGVHATSFVFMVDMMGLPAVLASVLAFCTAVAVSFAGHRFWTFTASKGGHVESFLKFSAAALLGLCVSTGVTFVVVNIVGASYLLALLLVVATVPVATYFMSKLWVFR